MPTQMLGLQVLLLQSYLLRRTVQPLFAQVIKSAIAERVPTYNGTEDQLWSQHRMSNVKDKDKVLSGKVQL